MEVVEDQPLRRGVEQVDERQPERRVRRAEVAAGQPEDGDRAERDGDGLRDEQDARVGPCPPERHQRCHDGVEVCSEPGDLTTG